MKNFENKLLSLNFDDILNFLTDIPKSELFLIENEDDKDNIKEDFKFIFNLKRDINEVKITNSLLKKLENDYEQCISKIAQKLENFKS